MSKPTPKPTSDYEVAENRLAPIRVWAHANHGALQRLTDALTAMTGRPVQRQTVGRWLHKDPHRRQQPSYGFGILLEDAAIKVQQEMRAEADAELARWSQPRTPEPIKPKAKKAAKKATPKKTPNRK